MFTEYAHVPYTIGFVQISNDGRWVQPSLGRNVSAFLAKYKDLLPSGANHKFTWYDTEKALAGNGGDADWTLLSFYVRRLLSKSTRRHSLQQLLVE